jgi:hypothetical protein
VFTATLLGDDQCPFERAVATAVYVAYQMLLVWCDVPLPHSALLTLKNTPVRDALVPWTEERALWAALFAREEFRWFLCGLFALLCVRLPFSLHNAWQRARLLAVGPGPVPVLVRFLYETRWIVAVLTAWALLLYNPPLHLLRTGAMVLPFLLRLCTALVRYAVPVYAVWVWPCRLMTAGMQHILAAEQSDSV